MKKLLMVLLLTGCSMAPQPGPVSREEMDQNNKNMVQAINSILEYIAQLQARGMLPKPGELDG